LYSILHKVKQPCMQARSQTESSKVLKSYCCELYKDTTY